MREIYYNDKLIYYNVLTYLSVLSRICGSFFLTKSCSIGVVSRWSSPHACGVSTPPCPVKDVPLILNVSTHVLILKFTFG